MSEKTELVIGLVAPVGVNLEIARSNLKNYLDQFNYSFNHIRLSSLIKTVKGLETPIIDDPEYERIDSLMTAGDEARKKAGRGDFIASLGICQVNRSRSEDRPLEGVAHIFDSIKHPDEVQTLRNIYGDGFYLLGIASSIPKRSNFLTEQKGISPDNAKKLIIRDESEEFQYGQHMRDAFHLSDAFVNIDADDATDQLARIMELIFGKPSLTPTRDEYSMFIAYAASLRSGDLSRQVGAVITSTNNEIISTGANDVPCSGGGLYWADDKDKDQRDSVLGYDSNEKQKSEIVIKVMKKLGKTGSDEELLSEGNRLLQDTGISDITEYGRAVHAEMEALISCARSGVSLRGGTLYTTTFPCHNCAKHIIGAGIKRVVFVEPYPKSKAPELHSDSIFLTNEDPAELADSKVRFEPFVGVGPRHFIDLFSTMLSSGRTIERKENGQRAHWERNGASLRVPLNPSSYIEREIILAAEINESIEESIGE